MRDLPLPPMQALPPFSTYQPAPWDVHLEVGEYLLSSSKVGATKLIALTRFCSLRPIVLIPALEKPIASNSSSLSSFLFLVIVTLVVESESSVDKRSCAATE